MYVSDVAWKIAALPDGVIAAAKKALPPTEYGQGLIAENDAWAGLPTTKQIMDAALTSGVQTPRRKRPRVATAYGSRANGRLVTG